MKRKKLLLFSLIFLCLSTSAHAQTIIDSITEANRRIDWSQPGIPGGIPHRNAVCATLSPGATGTDINNALASCSGSDGVVFLESGTYTISGGITFSGKSHVTLRGAGPDQTILNFTSKDTCMGYGANVCVRGSSTVWYGGVPSGNIRNWTAGYAKGTTQITLDDVSGLAPGMILILDQLDDVKTDTFDNTPGVLACDAVNVCSREGGSPGRADRVQQHYAEIISIDGDQVTISPGLHMPNWRASQSPQAWFWGTVSQTSIMNSIEDLTVDHTSSNETSGIVFTNAYKCWVRNVRSLKSQRNHIWINQATRIEVRDSYFAETKGIGNLTYGIEMFTSGNALIINNILHRITSPIILGNNHGSVYAYNYTNDVVSDGSFMFHGLLGTHDSGTGMNLFEGNSSNGYKMDAFHGTGNLTTVFRNHLLGTEPGKNQINTIPVNLWVGNRFNNIIGNILGTSGYHNVYEKSPVAGTAGDTKLTIYVLGYSSSGTGVHVDLGTDSHAVSTLLRWGNFDYATNTTRFEATEIASGVTFPTSQVFPASLFLSSKPTWWGTMPFPPIGPDVTGGDADPNGRAHKIPAQVCYEDTPKDANGILIFNADNCYENTLSPPDPPTNLRVVVN